LVRGALISNHAVDASAPDIDRLSRIVQCRVVDLTSVILLPRTVVQDSISKSEYQRGHFVFFGGEAGLIDTFSHCVGCLRRFRG
jgi:hypothetical protein